MKQVFKNETYEPIDRVKPANISSTIEISNIVGRIQRVSVTIDVQHSFTKDLKIYLIGPEGQEVLLVGNEGGSGDHFINTNFDDDSPTHITNSFPPFSGSFRPEGNLDDFKGLEANGTWTLRVMDESYLDGGSLNQWSLALTIEEEVHSSFNIEVRFLGGLTDSQKDVFKIAATRWSEIIIGDLPSVIVNGEVIDDVVIEARGAFIDGEGGILGQAGPTSVRSDSYLPATGIMEFDIGDLARMEADGSLLNVIIHEMGHVLGIGTIWGYKELLLDTGTANPVFTGANAMREFSALRGIAAPTPVPVANAGGSGTRDSHWRETIFGNELMTGFLDPGVNPISHMTIASLEDLGYKVNYNAADPYILPSSLTLAIMGVGMVGGYGHRQCSMAGTRMRRPIPVVLPKSTLVKE